MKKTPKFTIVLPAGMHGAIREFLFRDCSREQMGVILAGVSETEDEVKLLGRKFIPVDRGEYEYQSYAGLTVRRRFSQKLMQLCAEEGLSQIDVHSHPFGPSPNLWFSGTDDQHERIMGSYIYDRLPDSLYASLVMNQGYARARVWLPDGRSVQAHEVQTLTLAEFPFRKIKIGRCACHRDASQELMSINGESIAASELHARQVLAFGTDGQAKMAEMSVAMIGAGGIGSVMIQGLARLGFHQIVVIDPDSAEVSNLNRVAGMTYADAIAGAKKVEIACKSIEAIHPKVRASPICRSVFDPELVPVLKGCDIIVVATDNHATRMYAQRIGVQYLIPIVSVGVNIDVDETGKIDDISGEYAIALPGENGWCLACANAYNAETAAYELADPLDQQRWVHRGYMPGTDVKAPSVSHLNGVAANLALAEIHNLVAPYKPFQGYVAYDQKRSELMPYTINRNTDCAICSDKALLGLGDVEPVPDFRLAQQQPLKLPPPPIDSENGLNEAGELTLIEVWKNAISTATPQRIDSLESETCSIDGNDDFLQDNSSPVRLLAAMLVGMPLAILALAMGIHAHHWVRAIALVGGVEILMAVGLSKLGQLLGRRMERKWTERWGGLPTTHWLLSDDHNYSEQQQKDIWRKAVASQCGLDLESLSVSRDQDELRRAFDDAMAKIRQGLRTEKRAKSFRRHTIYYGLVRNIAALGWVATSLAMLSLAGALLAGGHRFVPLAIVFIETLFVVGSINFLILKDWYIDRCAERYAELFFKTLNTIADVTLSGVDVHPSQNGTPAAIQCQSAQSVAIKRRSAN